jgi:hypothetical protein
MSTALHAAPTGIVAVAGEKNRGRHGKLQNSQAANPKAPKLYRPRLTLRRGVALDLDWQLVCRLSRRTNRWVQMANPPKLGDKGATTLFGDSPRRGHASILQRRLCQGENPRDISLFRDS